MSTNTESLRAWLSLLRTAGTIKKMIDRRFRDQFGLSISRFDILSALDRVGRNGIRAGDLSRLLVVSEGNTTQVIAKLVRDGLVLRRTGLKDARVVMYSLSDQGKALFDEMAAAHREWITTLFAHIPPEHIHALRENLAWLPPQHDLEKKDVA